MAEMSKYDPLDAPDPEAWLALPEHDRIELVAEYHGRTGEALPNPRLHATFHAIVETQLAHGDELPVRATLRRLINDGLDRHEAIHAIGSVLAEHMYDILQGGAPHEDPNPVYYEQLEKLTAESWRQRYAEEDPGGR